MTVRWVVGDWGEPCGPRPSGGGDSGGVVTIEERGEELVITGNQGSFSSERCWEMHPGLARQSHSVGPRSWKTTCRTEPNDPRQEILQTTLTVADDVVSLQESGQYQFSLKGQTCSASSGRWRTYRRLPAQLAPGVPALEEPLAAARRPVPDTRCATLGAPARIDVRPSRKLMRGGESFQFRASVFDSQGCSLRAPVSWELSPAGSQAGIENGRLTIAEGASDAELGVVATAANQSVRVVVDVVSDARYAALLESGEFDADGASSGVATATITSGSLGTRPGEVDPQPPGRKWTFVGLVSVIALIFGLVGAWLLRRANRSAGRSRARRAAAPDPGTVVFAAEDALGEPTRARAAEATRLEPMSAPIPAPKPATVCPVCGTMYETKDSKVCPKDGAQLLPVNA